MTQIIFQTTTYVLDILKLGNGQISRKKTFVFIISLNASNFGHIHVLKSTIVRN